MSIQPLVPNLHVLFRDHSLIALTVLVIRSTLMDVICVHAVKENWELELVEESVATCTRKGTAFPTKNERERNGPLLEQKGARCASNKTNMGELETEKGGRSR
mmetsp:Transcript_14467/g.21238  ORF Transcript_14467/g.21238 Transcript_14467/m.21238 type:complete len:103 (-) Transcript_14467:41-349(-)